MSNTIDFKDFYHLSNPLATRPLKLDLQEQIGDQDQIGNKEAFELFSGTFKPGKPLVFKGIGGRQITDFLWTGWPYLPCVSEKVIDILLKHRFTGWSTFPVELWDRDGNPIPGYQGFSVTSYAGPIDLSKSQVITKVLFPGLKPVEYYKGMFFDKSNWNGSDIFRIQNAFLIVKKVVVQAFKANHVTNIRSESLVDTETLCAVFK